MRRESRRSMGQGLRGRRGASDSLGPDVRAPTSGCCRRSWQPRPGTGSQEHRGTAIVTTSSEGRRYARPAAKAGDAARRRCRPRGPGAPAGSDRNAQQRGQHGDHYSRRVAVGLAPPPAVRQERRQQAVGGRPRQPGDRLTAAATLPSRAATESRYAHPGGHPAAERERTTSSTPQATANHTVPRSRPPRPPACRAVVRRVSVPVDQVVVPAHDGWPTGTVAATSPPRAPDARSRAPRRPAPRRCQGGAADAPLSPAAPAATLPAQTRGSVSARRPRHIGAGLGSDGELAKPRASTWATCRSLIWLTC